MTLRRQPAADSRRTPIDDAYETCERAVARLLIYGNDLDPQEISTLLELAPTEAKKKGEVTTNSLGRSRTAKTGMWFLSSEEHVVSKDLRRHLDGLLARLTPAARALDELQQRPGIRMAVSCIWWSAYGDGGPTLWPEQMGALADLNLECSIEFAYFGDDEQPSTD